MLSPDTLLQGRYRVVRLIGRGGMGAVYEARHEWLGSTVALKETFHTDDEALRQAFRREARLLAGLRHPSLPRVTDYFDEGDGLYLVMEYVAGDDLAELLRGRGGAFLVEDVLGWAAQLLDVLDYLHTYDPPVIHRDIKPANVKLTARGEVSLLDFGLAKGSTAATTLVSVRGGTLAYAPPEQLHQQGTDARSDLFSLAATLYHLLTGELAPAATARLGEVGAGRPDPLRAAGELNPQVPAGVSQALLAAMSLERERRPSSAAELGRMLGAARRPLSPAGGADESLADTLVDTPPAGDGAGGAEWSMVCEIVTRSAVSFVALSPDGETLASVGGAGDYAVKLWRVGGELRQKLTGHTNSVHAAAFSPDGARMVTGASDATARLWDVRTGEVLRVLQGHEKDVYAVAFSPDGRAAASGSGDGTLRLWDAATGELLRAFGRHNSWVLAAAFSPDGAALASGSQDTTLKIWDVASGALLRTLLWHDGAVKAVAFSPDGLTLASGGADDTARLWDAQSGQLLRTLELEGSVGAVAFSRDGLTLASADHRGRVRLWDTRSGELRRELTGHEGPAWSLAISRDGSTLASGGNDKTIRLWKAAAAHESPAPEPAQPAATEPAPQSVAPQVAAAEGPAPPAGEELLKAWWIQARTLELTSAVKAVAFSPDGELLAAGDEDGWVSLWDVETGESRRKVFCGGDLTSVVFSPSGGVFATGGRHDHLVRVWGVDAEEPLLVIDGVATYYRGMPISVAYSRDGAMLATGGGEGHVSVWDAGVGRLLQGVNEEGKVYSVSFSPDGKTLAVGATSARATVKLWELATFSSRQVIQFSDSGEVSVAFSPDGSRVAAAAGESVRLWDVQKKEILPGKMEHEREMWEESTRVRSVAFSPCGRLLASCGDGRKIKIWDAMTGKLLYEPYWQRGTIWDVAFSPDSATLATASSDKTVILWSARRS